MQQLLDFLYRFRIFGLFLLLEIVCFWLYFRYNRYYNSYVFNSSNRLAGNIQNFSSNSEEYFELREINSDLAAENALLRQMISNNNLQPIYNDSSLNNQYKIIPAKVVNNSVNRSSNYLTLNKGQAQGIKPEMGIIAGNGVVGQIKSVSKNYSTGISLLHQKMLVSAELAKSKTLCTVQWDAILPTEAQLRYVPRHIDLQLGDSVITSGFNSIFPSEILIGIVSELNLPRESAYYEAKVNLAVDFQSLEYVYVLDNTMKKEKDSLEVISE